MGLRDSDRFAHLWRAAARIQYFWRCKLHQKRRSWQAIAAAHTAAQERWRRGVVATEECSAQTEGRTGGLVVTQDAWTQASPAVQHPAVPAARPEDYAPHRQRPRAVTTVAAEASEAQNAWLAGAAGSPPTDAEVAVVFQSFPAAPRTPPGRERMAAPRESPSDRADAALESGWESGADDSGVPVAGCAKAPVPGWNSGSEHDDSSVDDPDL